MQKLFFIFFIFILEAKAQFSFNDPQNKTTETSQAIYENGGENSKYRLTETEKALDTVKKQMAVLRQEMEVLKKQVYDLSKSNNRSPVLAAPLNSSPTPTPRPTVY